MSTTKTGEAGEAVRVVEERIVRASLACDDCGGPATCRRNGDGVTGCDGCCTHEDGDDDMCAPVPHESEPR